MKNIHILPTDKPSKKGDIIIWNGLKIWNGIGEPPHHNQNIYITSDEEIKEGDLGIDGKLLGYYGFDEENCPILKHSKNNRVYEYGLAPHAKKIILTDNQDLIKDGLQAIPDEFLEWFVKNPSREVIEVIHWKGYSEIGQLEYEIIIPKQETLEEAKTKYNEKDMVKFVSFVNKNYIKRKGFYYMKGDFEKNMKVSIHQILEKFNK